MQKRLLVVMAHPDDETFGMGGTLALYASQGADVQLICATRGEAGEVSPEHLIGFESIGALRQSELTCAARELGISKIHFLDYRDSGMPGSVDNQNPNALIQAPQKDVSTKIAKIIRTVKPQVVITFDPVGGYMHPDHIAVHKACVDAFYMAGDPKAVIDSLASYQPAKLYFHIFPRGILKYFVKLMPLFGMNPSRFGKNKDIDLAAVMAYEFPVHCRINYKKVALKRESASACHSSQGGDRQSGYILSWVMRHFNAYESFMQAYPKKNDHRIDTDLFAGLDVNL